MVLVGPSGCGKTTLLRSIAGLEDVTAGTIWIGDTDVTEKTPQQRDIAMVFQNYALYPHMSVADNLAYGLKLRRMDKGERDRTRARHRRQAGARRAPGPQAVGAVGRPAPARGDGPRDRARAEGVPDGRAAVEPRRQAARIDARRAGAAARAARGHDRVRDPRPGRGDDAGRAGGGDARRRAAAGRHAAEPLQPPAEPVRRRVHRLAGDEPRGGQDRRRAGAVRRHRPAASGRLAAGRRAPARDPRAAAERLRARRRRPTPTGRGSASSPTWSSSSAPRRI